MSIRLDRKSSWRCAKVSVSHGELLPTIRRRPEQQMQARARVQRYMNDPENKKWTDEFMIAFEKSNQGQEWYQARYNMGKPVKPINQEDNNNVG